MEIVPPVPVRKPSQVMAWLGFGISLSVLLMIWAMNAFIFSHVGEGHNSFGLLFTLSIPVFGLLGLLGLIFSIIGLTSALKNSVKKWPSVYGIFFCCLNVVSIFAPLIVAGAIGSEPIEVAQFGNKTAKGNEIVFYITDNKELKCYDNRSGKDKNPVVMRMWDSDKENQLRTWLQLNKIEKNSNFKIMTDRGVDYSDVVEIIYLLNSLGIKEIPEQENNRQSEFGVKP